MFDTEDAVDALCEAVGHDERPVWTVFDRDDGEADGFVVVPGPGAMLGWRAPAEVWAVGMAAGGTAGVLDGEGTDDRRCQVACVVDRWGSASGRIRFTSPAPSPVSLPPEPPGAENRHYHAPQEGRVLDILRRCLGLDTAPAHDPLPSVVSLVWLAAVAAEARRRRRPMAWVEAIASHPVISILDLPADADPDGTRIWDEPDDPFLPGGTTAGRHPGDPWVSIIAGALKTWEWGELRRRCIEHRLTIGEITPELAAWMDDGMFSRWLAEGVVDIDRLIDDGFDALVDDDHPALRRVLLAAVDWDEPEDREPPSGSRCGRHTPLHRR